MKLHIVVEVTREHGQNHSAQVIAKHICEQQIMPGELPAEPGLIWVEGAQYRITSATPIGNARG